MSAVTPTRRRFALPADLKPDQVTAIIDTREQLPLDLSPPSHRHRHAGHRRLQHRRPGKHRCRGTEGARGLAGLHRRGAGAIRAGGTTPVGLSDQGLGYRSHVAGLGSWPVAQSSIPSAAVGSVLGWIASGLPVVMAGNHDRAGRYVSRLLFSRRPGDGGESCGRWLVQSGLFVKNLS